MNKFGMKFDGKTVTNKIRWHGLSFKQCEEKNKVEGDFWKRICLAQKEPQMACQIPNIYGFNTKRFGAYGFPVLGVDYLETPKI